MMCTLYSVFLFFLGLACVDAARVSTEPYECKQDGDPTFKTDYDVKVVNTVEAKNINEIVVENTLLFVIDVQNDFVSGSLGQPCTQKRTELLEGIADVIQEVDAKNGHIIASMDYHTSRHCSFGGNAHCQNKDQLSSTNYENDLPPHTLFETSDDQTVPDTGALLVPELRETLLNVADKVNVVFKGFSDTKDSFSAFPSDNHDKDITGGFALGGSYPADCLEGDDVTLQQKATTCFPKASDLEKPSESSLTSVRSLVEEINPAKVVVVGLVWDFCVKETAVYTKRAFPDTEVIILADLARPALEGTELGGGTDFEANVQDMHENGVELMKISSAQ